MRLALRRTEDCLTLGQNGLLRLLLLRAPLSWLGWAFPTPAPALLLCPALRLLARPQPGASVVACPPPPPVAEFSVFDLLLSDHHSS